MAGVEGTGVSQTPWHFLCQVAEWVAMRFARNWAKAWVVELCIAYETGVLPMSLTRLFLRHLTAMAGWRHCLAKEEKQKQGTAIVPYFFI